ncbi:hypothetical protein [Bosea sp. BIWAKO-01]|uniref:hypothetical protein n=1 Tax=Bosea sp. BIWAKO-01 TaxID=506668 RepID=UPI00086B1B9F|nr:hypothetical protein [Bosea sp. BIWAKO-01]GAU85609.1 hypothetical protein BIWAKO_05557 [Bosea sp. BIWAKO-01]
MNSNYPLARAYLINAFLTLDGNNPEDDRLRRAVELLLEAVGRAQRSSAYSNVVRFPGAGPILPGDPPPRSGP